MKKIAIIIPTYNELDNIESLISAILIIICYQVKIASGLLCLFCIVTGVIFHSDFSNQMQLTSFLKNIALAGGFLFLLINGAKDFSLDKKYKK